MHISFLLMQRLHQIKNSWFPMKSCLLSSQMGIYQFRCSYIFPISHYYGVAGLRTLRRQSFHGSGHMLSFWNYSLQQELSECKFIGISRNLTVSGKSFVQAFPPNWQPYLQLMRIDRPIGVWLVFLPCAWSISLAAPDGQLPDAKMLTLFALGSFFMRGAGCIINDMWDKDFDSKVARTKDRPLASGKLTRFKALCFLSIPLSISLSILLTFNWNTIIFGVCSMIPCILYPLMKRVTYWPQAFLGLTQNWGILIAWSAICGYLDWPCLTLYLSSLLWTMTYDTVYSHQDKDDDMVIGVKSTAIKFGHSTKTWLIGFTGLISSGLLSTGYLCAQAWPYYLGVALFTTHLGHQIYSVDLNNPESCGQKFRSNRDLGLVFWLLIMAANVIKSDKKNAGTEGEIQDSDVIITLN